MLQPPDREGIKRLPPLFRHSFKVPEGASMDISVSGLGWIDLNGRTGARVDVWAPKGTKVVLRESVL